MQILLAISILKFRIEHFHRRRMRMLRDHETRPGIYDENAALPAIALQFPSGTPVPRSIIRPEDPPLQFL